MGDPIPSAGAPPLRRPIAVLVSRFPLVTETFILREIDELERQGQPVVLAPMLTEHPAVVHPEAEPWLERALGGRLTSRRAAAALGRAVARRPGAVLELLEWIVRGSVTRPRTLAKSLALLPRATLLAEQLTRAEVRHLHAHFATHPTTMALIIARLTGMSFSFTVHAHDIFVERALLREKLRRAAFVRSISQFNRAFLERLYPREAAGKIEVVHVGIPPERYPPGEPRRHGRPRLLCVAALKPYKGVRHLVEACRRLAAQGLDFELDVIGTGPLEDELRRAVGQAGLGDRVRLLGARPQGEVAAAMRRADLFVLPSVVAPDGQMEGVPVALMEAMASRLPVVSTSLSGIPELVAHGREGLLVDPANPQALAAAVAELLADPERRRRMGAAGRAKVTRSFALAPSVAALLPLLDAHNPPLEVARPALLTAAGIDGTAGLRRRHERSDSRVLELLVGGGGRPREVVLKQHRSRLGESRPPAVRAAEEHALLVRAGGHLAGTEGPPALRVPKPLALDAARGELLMERAEGTDLETLLRRWRRAGTGGRRRVRAGARAVGIWLGRFQTLAEGDGEDALERLVERALSSLDETPTRLPGALRRRVRRRVERLARRLRAAAPRAVAAHGDLWPGNVLLSPDAVTVLDLEGFHLALPSEDLAYLQLHLRLYLGLRRPDLLRLARRGLLAGYGREPDPCELELARRAAALALLAAPAPDGGSPQRLARRLLLLWEAVR